MQEKSEKERSIVEKRKKIEKGNSELNRVKGKERNENNERNWATKKAMGKECRLLTLIAFAFLVSTF